jgi:hypothetical protein
MRMPGDYRSNLCREEACVTPDRGERTKRGMMRLVAMLGAAAGAAYLVFLWLN